MNEKIDVLTVLADYSAQHGDPEDFEQARAAIAELIEATAYAPLRMEDAVRAYEKAGDFLSADHVRKEVARLRAALARVGCAK